MPALTQNRINYCLDRDYRGQNGAQRTTLHIGLLLVAATVSTPGTELSVGGGFAGYARQSIACTLTNFSGTQGDGTTSASSGSRDWISNNVPIAFNGGAALTAAWNGIVGVGFYSAASGGTLEEFGALTDAAGNPISISRAIGQTLVFAPGELRIYQR